MKLKHFSGYGYVNAKRISKKTVIDPICETERQKVVVEVRGLHEWGLQRDDTYDIYNWLMTKFATDCPDARHIENMEIAPAFDFDDKKNIIEVCTYTITYRTTQY